MDRQDDAEPETITNGVIEQMDSNVIVRRWTPEMGDIDNLSGTAFTGESEAHTFRIYGWNGSARIPFSGTVTATFLAGNNVVVPLTGSIDNGEAVVTLTGACYAVEGRFILSVYVAENGVSICVYCGVGVVTGTNSDAAYDPEHLIPSVADLISQAAVLRQETAYQLSADGTTPPSGTWLADEPVVPQGMYLWIRRTITFQSGAATVLYIPARQGLDGTGSVRSVNNYSPDNNGNVTLPLPYVNKGGDTMTGPLWMPSGSGLRSGDNYLYLDYAQADGTLMGALSFNVTQRRFYAYVKAANSDYHENFVLPAPDAGTDGYVNYDILTSKKTAALYSNQDSITTLAALVTYVSGCATGDKLIVRVHGDVMGQLAGSASYAGIAIILKASANNAYYFAFSRGTAAFGNISITNGTVSVKNLVATQ